MTTPADFLPPDPSRTDRLTGIDARDQFAIIAAWRERGLVHPNDEGTRRLLNLPLDPPPKTNRRP